MMNSKKLNLFKSLKATYSQDSQAMIALRALSQSMSSSLNPSALAENSIRIISQALGAQVVDLYGVNYEVELLEDFCQLDYLAGTDVKKIASLTIKNKSPLLPFFKEQRRTITQDDFDTLPELQALCMAERNWFKTLDMVIFIPIHTKEEWSGVLALGRKVPGGKYSEKDMTLLGIMADMLSLALQNIRLGESLLRVNNEFRRAYQAMEQSNRQLKQILSKLEKIDKTKSDFINIASHELRTPLTVMLGYNEMLMDDPVIKGNDYHTQLITGIHKGMDRMQEIVESMLVMATIDARSLALHKGEVSISSLIHKVQEGLVSALEERNIKLIAEKLSDLPLIEADGEALKKVFHQLITNAIKYTPNGGSITVTGSPATIGPDNMTEAGVEIVISDTGIGIDPKHLDMIFTKFYITGDLAHHSSGKVKFKGAGPGLGLAIAKGIVEAHGGKIWATSSGYDEVKCPGSQFHIILPLKNVLA